MVLFSYANQWVAQIKHSEVKILTLLCTLFISFTVMSQESGDSQSPEFERESKHILGLALAHSHSQQGVTEGKNQWLSIPSFEFSYNYRLNHKFMIGIHTDILLETFLVEDPEGELVERDYPFSVILVATYMISPNLGLEVGVGEEISGGESLTLGKLGLEYIYPLKDGFELIGLIGYDFVIDTYDTFNYGIGISKGF